MENASYALYIAVGVLIAIVILSMVLFRWRQIGLLETSKDETVLMKNRADFNAEFEAYNKNLMYGTDVLSCLNKAQNNNQKYVYNNYYGTETETMGKDDREEFFIDVEVTIHSTLYDEVRAFYKEKTGKFKRAIGFDSATDSATLKGNYNDPVFNGGAGNRFKVPTVYYYYFENGKVIQQTGSYVDIMWPSAFKTKSLYEILSQGIAPAGKTPQAGRIQTNMEGVATGTTYHLLAQADKSTIAADAKNSAKLSALITTVSLKSQDLYNNDKPSVFDKSDWWYCTWITAANDFKTRKFRCTGVSYNNANGYIEKISFDEYGY